MIANKSTILAQSARALRRQAVGAIADARVNGWRSRSSRLLGAPPSASSRTRRPSWRPSRRVRLDLPQPVVSVVEADEEAGYWREDRMRRGDTIGSVLARLGVDDPEALEFLRTNRFGAAALSAAAGQAAYRRDRRRRPAHARLQLRDRRRPTAVDRSRRRRVRGRDAEAPPVDIRWKMAVGEIRSSLFAAADAAGLPDAVTLQDGRRLRRRHRFLSRSAARRPLHGRLRGCVTSTAKPIGVGLDRRRRVREPRRALRAFLWRGGRRHAKTTTRQDGVAAAQGLPALADGILPRRIRLSRTRASTRSCRRGARTRAWTSRRRRARRCAPPAMRKSRSSAAQDGYGNVIELQHSGGFSTLYAHLSRFAPQVKSRRAHRAGRRHRLRRADRLGDRALICTTSSAWAASSAIR